MPPISDHDQADSQIVAELTECQLPLQLYVRGLMPGDPACHDVIQAANAKIWEKRGDFEPGTNFRAWAMAIARYEVLNHRKQQARDARLHFSDELEQTVAAELAELDDDLAERQTALRECIQSLKPASRELLLGRYRSRESLSETASRLGRSVGGLKVALHRLRSSLADCVERRIVSAGGSE